MLNKLNVEMGERSYPIYFSSDYSHLKKVFEVAKITGKILVITDSNVEKIHAKNLIELLENTGFEICLYSIPAGEKSKNFEVLNSIYAFLIQNKFDRSSTILALGGGVVGDIAGYAAATFYRGVNFVQFPTTLLASVDSSIGGKVAIDFEGYKNVIGTFYQPKLVYINVNTLKTLPKRELLSGLAEVIKHGIIRNSEYFEYVEFNSKKIFNYDADVLMYVIKQSCIIKSSVVMQDEREETGVRAILNFGHTIGHAIESAKEFELTHGECVAIGILGAFKLAYHLRIIQKSEVDKIVATFQKIGLVTSFSDVEADIILNNIIYDKKIKNGKLHFVLPKKIGEVDVIVLDKIDILKQVIEELRYVNEP